MSQEFIQEIYPYARKASKESGIPTSVIIAQAGLESGWGKSTLAQKFKNLFGIKGKGANLPTQEFEGGGYKDTAANFRTYESYGESVDDWVELLTQNERYNQVVNAQTPEEAARELQKAGYATDPDYSDKLIDIIKQQGLKVYDTMTNEKDRIRLKPELINGNNKTGQEPETKELDFKGNLVKTIFYFLIIIFIFIMLLNILPVQKLNPAAQVIKGGK